MESVQPASGGRTKSTVCVRIKPLGEGNSDTLALWGDGKASSKIFKGSEDNKILIGDTDPKKKVSTYVCNNVASDQHS